MCSVMPFGVRACVCVCVCEGKGLWKGAGDGAVGLSAGTI